jgi:hypothetical protein
MKNTHSNFLICYSTINNQRHICMSLKQCTISHLRTIHHMLHFHTKLQQFPLLFRWIFWYLKVFTLCYEVAANYFTFQNYKKIIIVIIIKNECKHLLKHEFSISTQEHNFHTKLDALLALLLWKHGSKFFFQGVMIKSLQYVSFV